MRSLVKSWDDRAKRRIGSRGRYDGWVRRVKWYEGPESPGGKLDIRLEFQDEHGKQNLYYTDKKVAQKDWDDFRAGAIDTNSIREARG